MILFIIFSTHYDETFFACLSKIHLKVYQNCILYAFSERKNWNMLFCERLWFSSPHMDFHWKFFALINFFSRAACQSCLLPGHTKFLRNNSLLQNRVLNHFQNSVEIVQNFNEVSPVGLSKLNYTSPVEQFEEKFCFLKKMHLLSISDFERNTFAHFSSFSRRSCRNCILSVQRNTSREKIFFR